jgi:hypothetical protein
MYAWKKPRRRQPLSIRESTGVDDHKDDETTSVDQSIVSTEYLTNYVDMDGVEF